MKLAMLSIALTGVLALPAAGQEKFTITIKKIAKGDVSQTTEKDATNEIDSQTVMGKTEKKNEDKTSQMAYKEVILEKEPNKRATKIKRTYE